MTKQAMFHERRCFPRFPIGLNVRVESEEGCRLYRSRDICGGGVFLLADEPPEEETKVTLELFFPPVSTPVRVKGEVVWKQRQEPCGFAVKFTEISESAQILVSFLSRQQRSGVLT